MTYRATHRQLRETRGVARDYTCACGRPAREWSFDHQRAADIQIDKRGRPWSSNLDDYDPLCRSCHVFRDTTDESRKLFSQAGNDSVPTEARSRGGKTSAAKMSPEARRLGGMRGATANAERWAKLNSEKTLEDRQAAGAKGGKKSAPWNNHIRWHVNRKILKDGCQFCDQGFTSQA